ncbi:MAG: hypothetical protein KDA54_02870 [Phycisphaerales bacterium]|nr:hypothetical protein [Phycisphaerales bacterium]
MTCKPTGSAGKTSRLGGFIVAALLCVPLTLAVGGCSWLVPLIFIGEHKEKVPAEFDKLDGMLTAVVVWADQETLFDYPHVRMELSMYISDKMWSSMKNVKLVDSRRIEDYIQKNVGTSIDPEKIGEVFDCDMVVYVELLDFQVRDRDAPDFVRGRIDAAVSVYDVKGDASGSRRYELDEVETVYPEMQSMLFNETNAMIVRKETYEKFAETIARKFYDHEVEL